MATATSRERYIEERLKYREIHPSRSWRPKPRVETSMLLDEASKDVVILVKNTRDKEKKSRYPCHRAILKKHIPALDDMCDVKDGEAQICIDRYTPEVVEQVLRYIYESSIHFDDWKNARDVMIMASEYQMKDLAEECEGFLKGSIGVRNACYLLELALQYKLEELKSVCLKFCSATAFIILRTKAFYEVAPRVVTLLTEKDDISVENELTVFYALWKWSANKCIREGIPFTDNNITGIFFEHVAHCVRFEFMDEQQKNALPTDVRQEYENRICEEPSHEPGKTKSHGSQNKNRCIQYIGLDAISATLVFVCEPLEFADYKQSDHITCWKFSLNIDSYLVEISAMYEMNCVKTPIKKLKVVGEKNVEFSWEPSSKKVDFIRLGTQKCVLYTDQVNGADFTVTVTEFRAIHMLLLVAGTYIIEIEPQDSRIKWPVTVAKLKNKNSDVVVYANADPCGLAKLQFLQAF